MGASTAYDFESFLQCSLCNQEITEPKFLPCFHRFCLHCIEKYTEGTPTETSYSCPECGTEFQIGKDGVAGLETDLYSKNIIECMKLRRAFLDTNCIRECYCCSRKCTSSAYCFKCPGFLCSGCLDIHEKNKVAKDHKEFLKVLSEETTQIAIKDVVKLRGVLRCKTHPYEMESLVCESCNGRNICVECSSNEHVGHKFVNFNKATRECTEKIGVQLQSLTQLITKISNFLKTEEDNSEEVNRTIQEGQLQIKSLQEEIQCIEKELQVEDSKIAEKKELLISEEKGDIRELKKEMDKKIDKVKEEYEERFEDRRKETRERVQELENSRNKEFVQRKSQQVAKLRAIQKSVEEKIKYIRSTKDGITKVTKFAARFEICKERLSRLQETPNSWIIVKDSISIMSAINDMVQQLEDNYPRIFSKATFNLAGATLRGYEIVEMTAQEEATIKIRHCGGFSHHLEAMACFSNGNSIILSRKEYFNKDDPDVYCVVVTDVKGQIVTQTELDAFASSGRSGKHVGFSLPGSSRPEKHLAVLGRDKVVVCDYTTAVLIHVKDLSNTAKKTIKEITSTGFNSYCSSCMTTDQRNKQVLFCFNEVVYITDQELRLCDWFSLPSGILKCNSIAFLNGSIFTCDSDAKKVYVLTTEGSYHRLRNPQITSCQWRPFNFCTDGNKYVYILWEGGRNGNIVVQYEEGDSRPLATRRVDGNVRSCSILRLDKNLFLGKTTWFFSCTVLKKKIKNLEKALQNKIL